MAHMPAPFTGVARDRHYTDAELKAIWKAADQLDPVEGGYVKLILLLGYSQGRVGSGAMERIRRRHQAHGLHDPDRKGQDESGKPN